VQHVRLSVERCWGHRLRLVLKELDVVHHFLRFIDFPNKNQSLDDLAEAKRVFGSVNDAGMWYLCSLQAKEIGIVSEYDPGFSKPISGLLFILGLNKSDFLRRGNVDFATAKTSGYSRVTALIQVEANRPSHWPSKP
jgi:hypothetical protein